MVAWTTASLRTRIASVTAHGSGHRGAHDRPERGPRGRRGFASRRVLVAWTHDPLGAGASAQAVIASRADASVPASRSGPRARGRRARRSTARGRARSSPGARATRCSRPLGPRRAPPALSASAQRLRSRRAARRRGRGALSGVDWPGWLTGRGGFSVPSAGRRRVPPWRVRRATSRRCRTSCTAARAPARSAASVRCTSISCRRATRPARREKTSRPTSRTSRQASTSGRGACSWRTTRSRRSTAGSATTRARPAATARSSTARSRSMRSSGSWAIWRSSAGGGSTRRRCAAASACSWSAPGRAGSRPRTTWRGSATRSRSATPARSPAG